MRAAGLESRIFLHTADIQDVQEMPAAIGTVQVTTIFFILHEILYLGEDRLIAFLKAYQQKFPGVPLMAFEAIRPTADEMRRRPGIGILLLPVLRPHPSEARRLRALARAVR